MKYFTLKAAEKLIPDLEEIYRTALDIQKKAEAKARRIRELESGTPAGPDLVIERSQLQLMVRSINECLQRTVALGALPKGLDPALVDFPYRLDGREVYLCWKLGEKKISHYHDLAGGFAGRKKLPSAASS